MGTFVMNELNRTPCMYLYNPFFCETKKWLQWFFFLWNSLRYLRKFKDTFVNKQLPPFLVSMFEVFYNDQRNGESSFWVH